MLLLKPFARKVLKIPFQKTMLDMRNFYHIFKARFKVTKGTKMFGSYSADVMKTSCRPKLCYFSTLVWS